MCFHKIEFSFFFFFVPSGQEVEFTEEAGKMYYFKYPVSGGNE